MAISEQMQLALEESRSALGWSSPNPAVGAVVVHDGEIVGIGRTQLPGGDHAEVVALRMAGDRARGAVVFVTLEPCSHEGSTAACTAALIGAGVSAVKYSIADPDPNVNGAGQLSLEAAGIIVEVGDGADEVAEQLEGYLHQRRTGRPFVIVKYAASLDGRIAASSGDSRWVSGPETLNWVHEKRAGLDAIVIGSGTIVIDDPELTARPGESTEGVHQPLRVVADSRGRMSESSRVLTGPAKTLIATTEISSREWRKGMVEAGAEVLVLPSYAGRVDLDALIQSLGARGALTVLFEGGGVLLGTLFDRRLVDRVQAIIAPIVIGAAEAPAAVSGRGVTLMAQVPRLKDLTVTRLGDDTLFSGLLVWPSEE